MAVHLTVTPVGERTPLLVFGIGAGTINVPVLSHLYLPRTPVWTMRKRLLRAPVRYKTSETAAQFSINGTFGLPTADGQALARLWQLWTSGQAVSIGGNAKIVTAEISRHAYQWLVSDVRVEAIEERLGIPIEWTYSAPFEETLYPVAATGGDEPEE